ncbi:MAG: alpha/beta fold hydrolase [Prevotella sp.]|uniref:alpha/beta hydrolase family protein n=1 Tax=Prevotella sp. TaxID=59823 RepID=UPI002A28D606|nr:alpha/beta fold hydrolase [Prevotella sp.]MDD7317836.1 alpha/beta fold hydrolase [Prevotellaceae bacterium]MDY4020751.1 alpha/beta fold hydrolase [Prevotella sp.]
MMKKICFSLLLLCSYAAARAQSLDGSWKGELKVGPQTLTMVLHVSGQTCKLDVIEQGAKGIETDVKLISDDSLSIAVPAIMMTYTAKLKDNMLQGKFYQATFSAPLNLERGEVKLNRPQEPKQPLPYNTKEVSFTNRAANATLAGTLTYPTGWKEGERVPVVLMVTGSGPENRDEEVFEHRPFLVLADHLARSGIASLRYDDRGFGKSTGDATKATSRDFADDAKAGIEWLRQTCEFGKVGVLGHSEGGMIAFMLGQEQVPDFIVSWAGPAVPIDTLMQQQLSLLYRAMGAPEAALPKTAGEAKRMMLAQSNTEWMRFFLDYDPTDAIKSITCPVFALNGDKDLNVPAEPNITALRSLLPANEKNKIKIYPGLNHMLQHCTTGHPMESSSIEETISPEAMQDIADWIIGL